MKAYGGVDVYIHIFLTSALIGGEWSASRPGRFTPGERAPFTHWIGGCGRRGEEKILDHTGTRTPTPRSSSLSLYRLSCPGSYVYIYIYIYIYIYKRIILKLIAVEFDHLFPISESDSTTRRNAILPLPVVCGVG
jgi:hypothetical protein